MSFHVRNLDLMVDQVHKIQDHRGQTQHICVTRLARYLEQNNHPQITIPLFQEQAAAYKKQIIREKFLAIKAQDLKRPCIRIENLNEIVFIDGKHRYVRAFIEGRLLLPCWQVKPVIWRQYVVRGMP